MSLQKFKWHERFLDLAKLISTWSKDPSTQVGAVITDPNNRIISLGYNGFPASIDDDHRLTNREEKYKIIIHAECNAIMFANKDISDCILYTYPFMPCPRCASLIIQKGIKHVVSYKYVPDRWKQEFEITTRLFEESNVILTLY